MLLLGLAAEMLLPVPREISRLVFFIDFAICVILLIDFAVRFSAAESKLRFLKWGWIDLVSSIPMFETLRWGRLFRIIRVIRLVVAFHSVRLFIGALFGNRRQAGLVTLLVLTIVVVSFASAGILLVETSPDSNIRTAEDALWWAMTTITTVGYGDRFPVTNAGRIIASLMMLCGIGLFGSLSGVAASFFGTGNDAKPSESSDRT
ncbi:MAG TPA: ion transporter [Haliangium sp.]|nr:ion transporter [Haliangium sp.]